MSPLRENRIDLVRGISLLLIFVDHAGVSFSEALQQSRGFSDAAELFVMMAGMSAALAYHPATGRADFVTVAARTLARSFKLYRIHLTLLLVLATAVFVLPLPNRDALVSNWSLRPLAEDPTRFAMEVLLLRYLPAELDILPLYIVLIPTVPLWFALIGRSPRLAVAASTLLWLAAGFFHLDPTDFSQPKGVWYFNPFSWQIVFLVGILAGLRVRQGLVPFPYRRWLFLAALAFCAIAVPANLLSHFGGHATEGPLRSLVSKTSEGPLRLINALAVVYVVFNLDALKRIDPKGWLGPVFAAGRNSLPVFVTGTILSDVVAASVIGSGGLGLPLEVMLVVLGITIQLALAFRLDRRKRRSATVPNRSLLVASSGDRDYDWQQPSVLNPMSDAARDPAT
ncbi:OpgC family protein [Jiella avicenniae]|uniref:OpgC domain-containing protein n=1 Tax=Jiella avicenniae TaxID=2907202 RepID=A0A9X1P606_9HYPH|nr:OpgC domain-containing protein [Jiella avicenniae]MCE7029928.1 OpgC domain-containing protein [Jiella avicenniae]